MTPVYLVIDFDPMASNWGEHYTADAFFSKTEAEADRDRRNQEYKADWCCTQPESRWKETWSYSHAQVRELLVK